MPDWNSYGAHLLPEAKSAPIHPKQKPAVQYEWSRGDKPRTNTVTRSSIAEMPQNSIKSGEPASAAASSSSSERRKDIIIHVFDENRNAKRDFYCKRQLLFREMKYFSTYLNDRNSTDHIDIDVHCDIEVFEWLMSYITRQRPSLEPRTAISILISSNFLQMLPLEDICLKYLHDHINEIVKVPIDMSCINKGLMIKLARLFSLEELGRIIDPRDKISSQIYFYKTCEVLGDDPRSVQLYCCMVCKKVYPKSLHKSIRCDKGRILVDYFGEITAAHTRDPNFNINEYIATIHSQDPSWKNIFWRIWSTVNHLKCQSCGSLFLCVDFQNCRKHLQRPLYSGSDSTVGTFGCCGATDYAFHPFHISEGCKPFHHNIDPNYNPSIAKSFSVNRDYISAAIDCAIIFNTKTPMETQRGAMVYGKWRDCVPGFKDTSQSMSSGAVKVPQYKQRALDTKKMIELTRQIMEMRVRAKGGAGAAQKG